MVLQPAESGNGRAENFPGFAPSKDWADDAISQILPDGRGWFLDWSRPSGIFKVRKNELEALAEGRMRGIQAVIHYGRDEGLFSLQANFGFTPEALRTREGELWMPMGSGLACITPTRLVERPNAPAVLLKRVEMDDETVGMYGGVLPTGDVLNLSKRRRVRRCCPRGHHRLWFEFTALDFLEPENLQFRYRLTGVDKDWIDGKDRRDASYPGLAAGRYEFKVEARRGGDAWTSEVAAFAFSIRPFFWETWWFRLGALAVFTASIFISRSRPVCILP